MKIIEYKVGWQKAVLSCWLSVLSFTMSMAGTTETSGALHSFHMNNGETRRGYVVGGNEDEIRIQVQLNEAQLSAAPVVSVLLKIKSIQKVIPLEWNVQESTMENREALERSWNVMNCLLGLPGARVGELGNALANALVKDSSSQLQAHNLQTAHALYSLIEKKSPHPEEQITARVGRFRIWMRQGKSREVVDEAETWIRCANPPLEAWVMLGESLAVQVEKLAQEHPCWNQDRFVKPKMAKLLNDCLEVSLLPFVRNPAHQTNAAQGLLRSARIYEIWGNTNLAKQTALDVLAFYPQFQKQAEHILSNLK